MKLNNYPSWIDEFGESIHQAFSHMIPSNWGPLNILEFFEFQNGSFFNKLHSAIKIIKERKIPIEKAASSFSCPSSLRCAMMYFIFEYSWIENKNKEQFKEIMEFFIEVLKNMMIEDVYSLNSNKIHSQEDIDKLINEVPFIEVNPTITREAGKLFNSCSSLTFSLYRDFFPQDSQDVYGPYNASSKFGNGAIMIIKDFPKLNPKEIWPKLDYPYKDIKIYQVFKDVKFRCEIIGMHSIYEGDLINNTIAIAVCINGKFATLDEIKKVRDEIALIATKQIQIYDSMNTKELKMKFLQWECYQFFDFFKLADMDWRPTTEMINAVKDKKIAERLIMTGWPELEEYLTSPEYEIYWLKDLYK